MTVQADVHSPAGVEDVSPPLSPGVVEVDPAHVVDTPVTTKSVEATDEKSVQAVGEGEGRTSQVDSLPTPPNTPVPPATASPEATAPKVVSSDSSTASTSIASTPTTSAATTSSTSAPVALLPTCRKSSSTMLARDDAFKVVHPSLGKFRKETSLLLLDPADAPALAKHFTFPVTSWLFEQLIACFDKYDTEHHQVWPELVTNFTLAQLRNLASQIAQTIEPTERSLVSVIRAMEGAEEHVRREGQAEGRQEASGDRLSSLSTDEFVEAGWSFRRVGERQ